MVTFREIEQQILRNNEQYIIDLITSGIDINNIKDFNGGNLLQSAISYGQYDIGRLLIDGGIDIDNKNNMGETALMALVEQHNLKEIMYLVEKGADIDILNLFDESALHRAVSVGNYDIVLYLLENGANINNFEDLSPLSLAIIRGNLKIIELLIDYGANINEKHEDGSNNLIMSIKKHDYKAAILLIKRGANIHQSDIIGNTPLYHALDNNSIEVVELLLEMGADLYKKNNRGESPYDRLVYRTSKKLVKERENLLRAHQRLSFSKIRRPDVSEDMIYSITRERPSINVKNYILSKYDFEKEKVIRDELYRRGLRSILESRLSGWEEDYVRSGLPERIKRKRGGKRTKKKYII